MGIIREQILLRPNASFVEALIILQKKVSKGLKRIKKNLARMVIRTTNGLNIHLEFFICAPVDHLVDKCMKPPKDNKKRRKKVLFNRASQKESENGDNNNNQKVYSYLARMSGNYKSSRRDFGDSSQLTNWSLDSGATCHMTPQVLNLITGSLEDTDKYIEVADGHHATAKQKGQVQIKMCNNNRGTFIVILHNVILTSDLCNRLSSIFMSMNLVHTCLFHRGFCMV